MYDLESGVSPNEGCTGSLHTHKNPGWTSKRIRFGDAGIKGRSQDCLPPLPAQPSPAPRRAPSLPSHRERCGAGRGAGAEHGSSPPHGRCPPAPHRATLLRETSQGLRDRAPRRKRRRLRAPGPRRCAEPVVGEGKETAGPQPCPAGSAGRGTLHVRTKPLRGETRLPSPRSPRARCGCPPRPPAPRKVPARPARPAAPLRRLREGEPPSTATRSWDGARGLLLCGRAHGVPGAGGRSAGVAGGHRARGGRRRQPGAIGPERAGSGTGRSPSRG